MAERDPDGNDGGDGAAVDEQELTRYLVDRIKPGLNRGSIPLLARSIAREIARDEYHRDEDEDEDEPDDERDDDDEDEDASELEAHLHELQRRLGSDWVLYFAVHDGKSWLTAETDDASQRVEAPRASVLVKAVKLLKEGGGRVKTGGGR